MIEESMINLKQLFYTDNLSLIMMGLVGFVAISIASFSSRYLKGDRRQRHFYFNLIALTSIVFIMVNANNIILLCVSLTISNFILTRLMIHKNEWEAARQSSKLALRNFSIGLIFLGSSCALISFSTGEISIQAIFLHSSIDQNWIITSLLIMFVGTMTQSALWPFHRWLTSSLNSPTPVSAIMHAGLVNGGGFILARFAPMILQQPIILNLIFVTGIVTALLGTLWKLMQSDVKRMLGCSTMGQMGFMMAQCGLGLFPAAIAHLCWHGLFKAYLFLASGSAAQEKRFDLESPISLRKFLVALVCGTLGAYMFSLTSGKTFFVWDTTLFLILLSMIAGTQFTLSIISNHSKMIPFAVIGTLFMGATYGLSVHLIEKTLVSMNISKPQPLNIFHIIGFLALFIAWIGIIFARNSKRDQFPNWMLRAYVCMLNASQPHPSTVTTYRNQYQF